MAENFKSPENEQPKNEQDLKKILDVLMLAFEKGSKVELTVLESSGKLRVNAVFIDNLEEGVLFVSDSEDSPVMEIRVEDIKKAE